MAAATRIHKSPFLAGFLSLLIPGLGQLYNEEMKKGVLIIIILLCSAFMFVLSATGFNFFHGQGLMQGDFQPFFPFQFFTLTFARSYFWLWLFVILPVIYIVAISDAVLTALKINRGEIGLQSTSSPSPSQTQTPASANTTANEQEALRMEAQEKMGTVPPNEFNAIHEEAAATVDSSTEKPTTNGSSGRMLLGIIITLVGFFILMEEWNVHELTFEYLWPVIPLIFGLRLLKDYKRDGNAGQIIAGAIFSLIGVVALVENYDIAEPFDWFEDFWPMIPIAIGLLLIFQELKARRCHRNKSKGSNS